MVKKSGDLTMGKPKNKRVYFNKCDRKATKTLKYHSEKQDNRTDLSKVEQFLDYYRNARSKATYKMYKRGIRLFEEYYQKSADKILEERKQDVLSDDFQRTRRFAREIEKFYNWLVEKGYSENSARTNCQGIMQFFRFYGFPIALEPKSKVSRTTVSTKTWIPSIDDLRKMFNVADLRAKVILSLGLDVAWRVNDFLQIKKSDIDLTKKPPIPIERITEKQKILSSTFVSSETVELLKAYIPTLPKDNDYLFPSKRRPKQPLDEESIYKILRKLARKAKVKIPENKRFTFHSLRKRFLSTCYSLGIDSEISKLLVGKSIGSSTETYLYDVKLQDAFKLVREQNLKLSNGTIKETIELKDKEIAELKKQITELQTALKTFVNLFQSEIAVKTLEQLKQKGLLKTLPIKLSNQLVHGTIEDAYTLILKLAELDKQKQAKEYQKLLKEVNNWNNK